MEEKQYLIPGYLLKFECAMCTKCCKRKWAINIDKHTMRLYHDIAKSNGQFRSELKKYIEEDKNGLGTIILKDLENQKEIKCGGEIQEGDVLQSCVCPFLNEKGLCSIQKRFGVEALSDTCKIYPRNITLTERGYEMSLSFSCRVAAELLKDRDQVQFYQNPQNFSFVSQNFLYGLIGSLEQRKKDGKVNYFEIEELLIDIIQLRDIDIESRLILVGMTADKIREQDITELYGYLQGINHEVIAQLKAIPSIPGFMIKLVKEVLDSRLLMPVAERDFHTLMDFIKNNLNLLEHDTVSEENIQTFIDGYSRYYREYIPNIEYVYENYFVNFIFSKKYYNYSYKDAYLLMILFFIFIRFFTICRCIAEQKQVNEDMLVDVISAVECFIGHTKSYYEAILDIIKKGEYSKLEYIISLINL